MARKSKVIRRDKFKAVDREIQKRAREFANAVGSVGMTYSRQFAPVAYSVLVNSAKMTEVSSAGSITVTVGYYTDYAKYLEDAPSGSWKPKPPPKYGNEKLGIPAANAWNPNAKPGFLSAGFEDDSPRANIAQLRDIFKF